MLLNSAIVAQSNLGIDALQGDKETRSSTEQRRRILSCPALEDHCQKVEKVTNDLGHDRTMPRGSL